MHVPSHPTLIRRMLESRLNLVNKRCGQPSCRCHHGGPLHQAYHLTFREAGKLRNVYVPQDLLEEVQQWVQEHQRLKTLTREVSQLTLALIQGHVQDRQRRRGRR
jgi:hypothetical protein